MYTSWDATRVFKTTIFPRGLVFETSNNVSVKILLM